MGWFDESDLEEWGFEPWELTPVDDGEIIEGNTDPDDVPEIAKNQYGVVLGDIYKLGNHRLMCGDSTSIDDVEKLMDGEKADMVFTDPPYGVSYTEIGTLENLLGNLIQ